MAESTIAELEERIETLEREVGILRSQNAALPGDEWAKSVSGSMKDIPQESYDEFQKLCLAVRRGELSRVPDLIFEDWTVEPLR